MNRVKRQLAPYFLVLPGGLWLLLFFAIPMIFMLSLSLQQGDVVYGFRFTGHWQNYTDAISDYHTQLVRSLIYGVIATVALVLLAFPVAYWIAFYGGRRKSTYLFLLLLPFFVSFVLRTISWRQILTDEGPVLHPLKQIGLLPDSYHLLGTSEAVIGGLVYNFLPFMVLPIYVALERIDRALIEAASDLYASRREVFRRIVLPLSLPGVFAGVILTFVPAAADYVNAQILGGSGQVMIGNIIETLYITNSQYPQASALSSILLGALLIGIFVYARVLGTRDVLDASAG